MAKIFQSFRRRLAAWNDVGVWDQLHPVLLKKLRVAKKLDWSRAVIGSSHVRAARRGPKAGLSTATVLVVTVGQVRVVCGRVVCGG
ncbi:hypothetical protein ACFVZH_39220 [Streptomyces sp. NPDC059534]|uniref:hypothetical protein n=1 Tax=Streptomyces sp. NPDC059534 TaxID=3346859 RepID=UPI0036850955